MDAAQWSTFLSRELGAQVEVAFGRARRSVLVARPVRGGYRVRMHCGFEAAPEEVCAAAAAWLRSGRRARRATSVLDAWIDGVLVPSFAPAASGAAAAVARGNCHDLERLANELFATSVLAELLPRERRPTLSYGLRPRTRARRSLHLGTYDAVQNLVRIHRVLDQPVVPEFFVRYILFHELLHAAFPPRREAGRTVHHGPEFRQRERTYIDFARAKAWEHEHIARLIKSARTGKALSVGRAVRERVRESGSGFQRLLFG